MQFTRQTLLKSNHTHPIQNNKTKTGLKLWNWVKILKLVSNLWTSLKKIETNDKIEP